MFLLVVFSNINGISLLWNWISILEDCIVMFAQSLNLSINAIYDCSFQYRSNILLKIGSCYFFLECICPVVILFKKKFFYTFWFFLTYALCSFRIMNTQIMKVVLVVRLSFIASFFSLKLEQAPFSAYTIKLYYFISFNMKTIHLRGFLILDNLILMNESKYL